MLLAIRDRGGRRAILIRVKHCCGSIFGGIRIRLAKSILIGYDLKVSLLLAGIANSLDDDVKGL